MCILNHWTAAKSLPPLLVPKRECDSFSGQYNGNDHIMTDVRHRHWLNYIFQCTSILVVTEYFANTSGFNRKGSPTIYIRMRINQQHLVGRVFINVEEKILMHQLTAAGSLSVMLSAWNIARRPKLSPRSLAYADIYAHVYTYVYTHVYAHRGTSALQRSPTCTEDYTYIYTHIGRAHRSKHGG